MSQNPLALSTTGPLPGLTAVSGINNAFDSLSRWLSGPTAPAAAGLGLSSLAGVVWHDTAANTLKVRDQADSAWITVGSFDEANKLFQAAMKTDASLRQSASGLSVNESITLVAANQTITASSHFANLVASAAVTLTLAQTSILGNGACAFSLSAQGGAVTLAPNAADSIVVGQTVQAAGASYVLAQGASAFVVCDGAGKWYLLFLNIPTAASVSVPVRQTVLSGVSSGGVAAMITTGSGLAPGLLASSAPLVIAFAAGFGASGAVDYVERITADTASFFPALAANSTSYLHITRTGLGAVTGGASLLAPVYSYGAPSSPATGQDWFDLSGFVMRSWTGTAWAAVNRVYVGEAVTASSAVTSVISYAFRGCYDSGLFAVGPTTNYAKTHNVGVPGCQMVVQFSPDATGVSESSIPGMFYSGVGNYGWVAVSATRNSTTVATSNGVAAYSNSVYTNGYYRIRCNRGW